MVQGEVRPKCSGEVWWETGEVWKPNALIYQIEDLTIFDIFAFMFGVYVYLYIHLCKSSL